MAKPVVPSNLRSIIVDFTADLTVVFPEYAFMWSKWETANDTEYEKFHAHCLAIYPERFFDILYTNADIFKEDNKANVSFLPDVNFRLLFNCAGVSDKTKTSIWKYLQLILFTVLGSVNDPKRFGDAANLFEAMDENELHAKMAETLESVGDFFKNMDDTDDNNMNEASTEGIEASQATNDSSEVADIDELSEAMKDIFKGLASASAAPSSASAEPSANADPSADADNSSKSEKPGFKLPNPDILKEHLKTLLEGKLGKLAKEFTDEFTTDLKDFFDENDALNMKSSKDVLMKLIKDPQKMMLILKKITSKLQDKMKRGEISQEELMGEMAGLMEKMKDMGGGGDFADMMKGLSGTPFMKMFEKGMGGAKMDMNKVNQMSKQSAMKDRLRKKLEQRKAQAAQLAQAQAPTQAPVQVPATKVIPITDKNFVVKIGNSVQEKSGLRPSTSAPAVPAVPAVPALTSSTCAPSTSNTEQIASVSKKNKGNKKSK